MSTDHAHQCPSASTGTLHPNCQDSSGRPRRDIGTILQILNDLLSATRHYQGMPPSLTQLRCHAQCAPASPAPDLAPKTTSCEKLAAAAPAALSQARICKPLGECPPGPACPQLLKASLCLLQAADLPGRWGGAASCRSSSRQEPGEKGACVLRAQSVLVPSRGGGPSPLPLVPPWAPSPDGMWNLCEWPTQAEEGAGASCPIGRQSVFLSSPIIPDKFRVLQNEGASLPRGVPQPRARRGNRGISRRTSPWSQE